LRHTGRCAQQVDERNAIDLRRPGSGLMREGVGETQISPTPSLYLEFAIAGF